MSELLKCKGCNDRCIERDEDTKVDEDGYAVRYCGECVVSYGYPSPDAQSFRTLVADWEVCPDGSGDDHSPEMLPVVITVKATSREEAMQAAADKLQEYYGPAVEQLYRTDIERDEWFGNDAGDYTPLLRVAAIFVGSPELDNDDAMTTVIA
ncbi:hypothetical protein AB0D37_06735 [Streptomyces sp. NPDC048384]|uniref:hypothetical protein n=1 Tax=Streptomyces sp. NPDC048384 TaxID=3155487 RepID=UPI003437A4D6